MTTDATKDHLARELRYVADKANPENATIYRSFADRAETGEFDDYADVHVCGPTALYTELMAAGFSKFASRVAAGEFDASREESEVWARQQTDPEIIKIMNAMGIGPSLKGDH